MKQLAWYKLYRKNKIEQIENRIKKLEIALNFLDAASNFMLFNILHTAKEYLNEAKKAIK